MNCKIVIQYDGSKFYGSQKQPKLSSVESTLQEALSIFNIDSKLLFSGRTDRNVHATGQVISLDIPFFWKDLTKLKDKLNNTLPNSVYIKSINPVEDDFHARFSAKKRSYRYLVSTKKPNPFNNDYITYLNDIDELKIKEAVKQFVGTNDFKNFSKEGSEPNSTIRTIYEAKFYKYKEIYVFKFTANAFLRSQIRLMIGFLLAISEGKKNIKDLKSHLKNDKLAYGFKKPAPANGLYLSRVIYN